MPTALVFFRRVPRDEEGPGGGKTWMMLQAEMGKKQSFEQLQRWMRKTNYPNLKVSRL